MVSKFTDDLAYGQAAEAQFHTLYPNLIRTDGRKGDFINSAGELVELKTDRYQRSTNLFMERYSFSDFPGGAFQASANNVVWYAYWFPKLHELYVFNVHDLIGYLDWRFSDDELIKIVNETHITRGWKVPKDQLAHLLVNPSEVLK
jgi:hypothetical protein